MQLFRKSRKSPKRKPSVGKKSRIDNTEKTEVMTESDAAGGENTAPVSQEEETAPFEKANADRVFHYFREISAIPHGSHHTKEISDYIAAFAKEKGLEYVQDDANNVIISKKASEGCEDAEPIALQGHIDMVLASEPDKEIDLLTEPVSILVDGDWMSADGTTLGADNGIAVAMMLAALEDDEITHPYLECIFTSDEEVGLIGANAIDISGLKSRRLLNLDSEDEGVFTAGCAGGAEVVCRMPLKLKNRQGLVLNIAVSGLRGGHSGAEIHIGSANGNVLMSRMLRTLYSVCPFNLIRIDGGDADNAVPTGAKAQVLFSKKISCEEIEAAAAAEAEALKQEYSATDPGMKWDIEWKDEETVKAASKKNTDNLLMYLMALPNGITHMSHVIAGMPQTSLNLGIIRTEGDAVRLELMVRSGVNSQAAYLADRLVCITKGFGGKPEVRTSYPAWEYRDDSPLRDLSVSTYKKLYGEEPKVEVIHAGLECGILAGKLEGLDCLSAGPDLENVHTVRERMKISSVENVWTFVLALLKEAAL